MYTVRIKPLPQETLFSFMTRCALENGTSLLTIWNDVKRKNTFYSQSADVNIIDFSPNSTILISALSDATGVSCDRLLQMTFHNLLKTFCDNSEISKSRILRGMIREDFYYCPLCLNDNAYIRLKWKVVGVNYCVQHQQPLYRFCSYCEKAIRFIDVNFIGECPYCGEDLQKSESVNKYEQPSNFNDQVLIEKIWDQLLTSTDKFFSVIDVATRLLYLLNECNEFYNKEIVLQNANVLGIHMLYMLQMARGTLSEKRTVHVSTIIKILLATKYDFHAFQNMMIPNNFVLSINQSNTDQPQGLSCISPWCKCYHKIGSLMKTGTKSKVYSDGRKLNNHMACVDCGCHFAVNENGELVEKEYFIRGYYAINKLIINGDLTNLEKPKEFKKESWTRIIAYFQSRSVFTIPEMLDSALVDLFVQEIKKHGNISGINKWSSWRSNQHYLLYRYSSDVLKASIFTKRKITSRVDKQRYQDQMVTICNLMIDSDEDITIGIVSEKMRISSNTLRKWGFNDQIKTFKKRQADLKKLKLKELLLTKVNRYFEECEDKKILSMNVYRKIGVRQSYLCKVAPEVNVYIRRSREDSYNLD